MNILQAWLAGSGGGTNPLAFIFKIVTTSENEQFTMPTMHDDYMGYDYVYDYKIGYDTDPILQVSSFDDANATYIFPTIGEHTISILGRCESFSVGNTTTLMSSQLTEIVQWGSIGAFVLDLYGCTLLTSLPLDLAQGFSTIINFSGFLSDCSGITEIPAGLFDYAVNVTDLSFAFTRTHITTIPIDLFRYTTLVSSMNSIFDGTYLSSIPTSSFAYMPILGDVSNMFKNCNSLTSVGAGLFGNNSNIASVRGLFEMSGLASIPETLFWGKVNLTNATSTFKDCQALTSIPPRLWEFNPAITNFNTTFSGCVGITSIPPALFQYNTNVLTFTETFASCLGLTSLPGNLFATCTKVTSFEGVFRFCQYLTTTPANLFAGSALVTNYQSIFIGCIRLATIDANTFPVYNTKTINFYEAFRTCNGLTAIPSNLFDNMPNITGFVRTFHIPSAPGLITGALPALWVRSTPGLTKTDCFHNRTAASNYATATTNGWT